MKTDNRLYHAKDVDMLVTAATIVENAIANKRFLQTKRSTWTDPFFDDLKLKIETATQTFLGVDSAKELRGATQALMAIQKQAIKDLAECKVQVAEDFKNDKTRRDELLRQLGFTSYLKYAQKGDQEALLNLLYQFKTNLTTTVKDEIVTKGTDKQILDGIIAYADGLRNANVNQENFKGQRKTITAAAVNEFNDIYNQVISVCKISAKFYKDEPVVKDQFSFAKVLKALNNLKPNIPVKPAA